MLFQCVVVVRVHAGVNPTDFWHRETGGLLGRPVRLGGDLSGVVEAVGIGAALFRPGDEVFGMPRLPQPAGGGHGPRDQSGRTREKSS
ncbi:alcohol dehydrogenase catalytic domain-containing protein [Micromonospora sp. LOL_024]|uniref:alcohol dehydrogenase catalytic domain-containing protein n=1 Tax=Micromonospora sp. LOL_024 TaxID=3345412 RepID=UPI003A896858